NNSLTDPTSFLMTVLQKKAGAICCTPLNNFNSFLIVFYPNKIFSLVPYTFGFSQKSLFYIVRNGFFSGEDPHIIQTVTNNQGISVIFEVNHIIPSPEWFEEGYFKTAHRSVTNRLCFAFRFFPLVLFIVISAVKDTYISVVFGAIFSGYIIQVFFPRKIQSGNFVPLTQIPLFVKVPYRLRTCRYFSFA